MARATTVVLVLLFLGAVIAAAVIAYRAKRRADREESKADILAASHNRLAAAGMSGAVVRHQDSLLLRAGGVVDLLVSAVGCGDRDGGRRRSGAPLSKPLLGDTSNFRLADGTNPLLQDPRDFTAEELSAATADFAPANKLDEGACGAVFRGVLPGGQSIAIKVLKEENPDAGGSDGSSAASAGGGGGGGGGGSSGGAGGWGGAGGDRTLAVTMATAWTSINTGLGGEGQSGGGSSSGSDKSTLDSLSPLAQFRREAEVLLVYRHRNIVTLLGTCFDARAAGGKGGKRHYLAMEHMEGGSLKSRLRPPKEAPSGGWDGPVLRIALTPAQRFQIAADVARALSFLHNEANPPIIHHDVKSANILMGTDPITGAFIAKMADFGAVRRFVPTTAPETVTLPLGGGGGGGGGGGKRRHQRERSHMKILDIIGTEAYMPHEYTREGRVSEKTDSYAFGVVLLELLTGRPPVNPLTKEFLAAELMEALEQPEAALPPILDRGAGEWPIDKALALARIARRCIDLQWRKRCTLLEALPELNDLAGVVAPAPAARRSDSASSDGDGSYINRHSHAAQYNHKYG